MNEQQARPLAGVVWMLVTGLNFVAVTAIVKHVGDGLPSVGEATGLTACAVARTGGGVTSSVSEQPVMKSATIDTK